MECKLDNITVHYEMIGEGRPLVVIHGWGSTIATWPATWNHSSHTTLAGNASILTCQAWGKPQHLTG